MGFAAAQPILQDCFALWTIFAIIARIRSASWAVPWPVSLVRMSLAIRRHERAAAPGTADLRLSEASLKARKTRLTARPSHARRSGRRRCGWLTQKFRADAAQRPSPRGQEVAIVVDRPVEQSKKCNCFLVGQIDLHSLHQPPERRDPGRRARWDRYARGWWIDYESEAVTDEQDGRPDAALG